MTKTELYCRDCQEECEGEWVSDRDIGGEGYYKCCQCGGDDMTQDYSYCDHCKKPKPDDEISTGLILAEHKICWDCMAKAKREFEAAAEAKIFSHHSITWREAVNLAYDGECF